MTEWKEYKFSDFVEINPSVKIPKGIPVSFVEMKDLDSSVRYCESSQKKELTGGSRFINGDTLFARITPCLENGKICQVRNLKNNFGFGSTEFHVFRGKDGVSDTDFVYYLSRWDEVRDFAEHNLEGSSGRQRVSKEAFDNLYLILPSLDIQRRIASILTSLDDKIDLLRRENATLEAMAETLFRQWFVEDAKEEWEEGKLGDIVDVKSGFAFKSSSFVDFGLYRLITIKAVQDGCLTLENADYISEIPDNIKDYCLLKEGDILLSLTGNVGRCCLVDRERLLLNQRVALLCAKDNKNWAFVYTLFRMQSMKSELEEMAKGTAQPNLSPIELSNMQFDIPPTKLLDGFSDAATPLLRKALSNNKQIQTLIETRDGLLPRLMSGEVKI